MNEAQTEKLMNSLGIYVTKKLYSDEKGTNLLACCPIHGERHPSFAVHVEKGVYNCFACGATGGLVKLIAELKDCSLGEAYSILEEFDGVDRKEQSKRTIRRYDDAEMDGEKSGENTATTLPMSKIAPFRSGKVSIEYLCKRGFHQETLRDFRIGWNRITNRITIPLFSRSGELWGWSERAVFDKGDPEYYPLYKDLDKYIIHEYRKSLVVYPLDKYQAEDDTCILVEGLLNAIWMHQLGYHNVLSIITATLNKNQIPHLRELGARKVVLFLDNDAAGKRGKEHAYKLLKDEFSVYDVIDIEGKNDPQEMTKGEIQQVLDSKFLFNLNKKLLRIS